MQEGEDWDSDYESGNFKHWEPIPPSPEISALVASGSIKKDAEILDVGCGGGLDAIFLAQIGFSVAGIDVSRKALEIARDRSKKAGVRVDWLRGSTLDLPIESEALDWVTDRGLFHLIEDSERPKYSSEVFRVLKPNGHLLIRGASEESSAERFNPITESAVAKFFGKSKWDRGRVVPIPLFSSAGVIDGRIAILKKL